MKKRVFITGGYNTISMGSGRKEFNPKRARAKLLDYIQEAGKASLEMVGGAKNVDEAIISNFNASGFNNQSHLAAMLPSIDKGLKYKPCTRVEGACASGGLALVTAFKSILSDCSESVLTLGVEVQNELKAVYGADILSQAGWRELRKEGEAYFFPGEFSQRAGAYFHLHNKSETIEAMALWYENAITNARLCHTAQEFHNNTKDLKRYALREPNPKTFVENLNMASCSKVSDGGSSIVVLSENGVNKFGVDIKDCVEIIDFVNIEDDITLQPSDLTTLETTKRAVNMVLNKAEISIDQISTIELHDCFSIVPIMVFEALGLAKIGKGSEFITQGHTRLTGKLPTNTTGGLIGWGHPVGATGVHQAVTIWEQFTGKAGKNQIHIPKEKPYALSINMGGNDKTVVAIIYRQT